MNKVFTHRNREGMVSAEIEEITFCFENNVFRVVVTELYGQQSYLKAHKLCQSKWDFTNLAASSEVTVILVLSYLRGGDVGP